MSRRKVLLISLGVTITMTRSATGGLAPTLTAADLVRAVAGIEAVADIEAISPLTMPGASLSIDDIVGVATLIDARLGRDVDGAVVIQGTDTIEESAFLFDLLVRSERPVVVTGAMRGALAPGADGPANVLAATLVAAASDASGLGTLVVMNDEIHAARFVQKSHTALPSAFTSPLSGPLGLVVEGRARMYSRPVRRRQPIAAGAPADTPVALIRMSLGDDGRLLREVEHLGYRGVVLEGMGAGHVPSSVAPLISDLVKAMPVILATRVHTGPAFTSTYGSPAPRPIFCSGAPLRRANFQDSRRDCFCQCCCAPALTATPLPPRSMCLDLVSTRHSTMRIGARENTIDRNWMIRHPGNGEDGHRVMRAHVNLLGDRFADLISSMPRGFASGVERDAGSETRPKARRPRPGKTTPA